MSKLEQMKKGITDLKNSELHSLRSTLELEIYVSEESIAQGQEVRR